MICSIKRLQLLPLLRAFVPFFLVRFFMRSSPVRLDLKLGSLIKLNQLGISISTTAYLQLCTSLSLFTTSSSVTPSSCVGTVIHFLFPMSSFLGLLYFFYSLFSMCHSLYSIVVLFVPRANDGDSRPLGFRNKRLSTLFVRIQFSFLHRF